MTRAEKVIAFIENWCYIPEGKYIGNLVELENWQKEFIRDTYADGIRRSYLSIARKNGKTTLIAFLVIAHLIGPAKIRNSQIISGAQSEPQAALIYNTCCKILRLNPELDCLYNIRQSPKSITGLSHNVEYKPLAAKASTAFGLSPVVAILDEVGQVRGEQNEFVTAITTSQGAYENPLLIAISTQAATDSDLFSIWIDYAKKKMSNTIACHVHASDPDCDILDEEQWKKANPGLGTIRSLEDLEEAANTVHDTGVGESDFRNLFLNQRVERFDPYVSRDAWKKCSGPVNDRDDIVWYAGLDLSATQDLTAYVRVGWQIDENGQSKVHCIPRFFLPADGIREKARKDRSPYTKWVKEGYLELIPGAVVDYKSIAKIIIDDIDSGKVSKIGFDRWGIGHFWRDMVSVGAKEHHQEQFREIGQGYYSMSPALRRLDEVIYKKQLRHADNPVLKMCAQNSVVQTDPAGNRKLIKVSSNRRIDGMVALAMAVYILGEPTKSPIKSIYDDPDFVPMLTT